MLPVGVCVRARVHRRVNLTDFFLLMQAIGKAVFLKAMNLRTARGRDLLSPASLFFSFSPLVGFRRNEEMRAMEVLPILKEKVAFLSGKIMCVSVIVCFYSTALLEEERLHEARSSVCI